MAPLIDWVKMAERQMEMRGEKRGEKITWADLGGAEDTPAQRVERAREMVQGLGLVPGAEDEVEEDVDKPASAGAAAAQATRTGTTRTGNKANEKAKDWVKMAERQMEMRGEKRGEKITWADLGGAEDTPAQRVKCAREMVQGLGLIPGVEDELEEDEEEPAAPASAGAGAAAAQATCTGSSNKENEKAKRAAPEEGEKSAYKKGCARRGLLPKRPSAVRPGAPV
ncbi:hypothetical protein FOA52_012764 [Chlamydomonas sp. UWO 241]|nr:hypothetical protein FOA52_012764 [Chlamydomonas sp. UWO 241]